MNLTEQQKIQLFLCLQKAFTLGLLCGRNMLEGAQNPASQIDQAINASMQNFNQLNPGSDLTSFLNQLMLDMNSQK